MSEIFATDGKKTPVTLIEAGPCQVTQVKTKENDGYTAVQLGYESIDSKKVKKAKPKSLSNR